MVAIQRDAAARRLQRRAARRALRPRPRRDRRDAGRRSRRHRRIPDVLRHPAPRRHHRARADEQVADSVAQANPAVGPGFFDATSIPLRAGRDFTAADSTASPNVVIVNESFVRKFGLGDNAVGTTLRLEGRFVPQSTVEIVGVVGDAKYSAIKPDIPPQLFAPRPAGDAQFVALFYYVRASIDRRRARARDSRRREARRSEHSREQSRRRCAV